MLIVKTTSILPQPLSPADEKPNTTLPKPMTESATDNASIFGRVTVVMFRM